MNDFAARLRRLRESRGWTMYRLAKLSGISKEGIHKLERTGSDPKLSTLTKLVAAFGVPWDELLPEQRTRGQSRAQKPDDRAESDR
jgi:transcriptional regulator with XRE-family HTH domain